MSELSPTPQKKTVEAELGGVFVAWILSQPVRSYESKKDGQPKTVVELRDPARLGNSITVFLDGEAGPLAHTSTNALVKVRFDEVRPGQGRGELVGTVERAVLEAACAKAAS
jgi:hypothetical protein